MRDFNDPSARLVVGMRLKIDGFLSSTLDMRNVAVGLDRLPGRGTAIAGIGTQVLMSSLRWIRAVNLYRVQHISQLRNIMPIRAGHDE